MSSTEIDIEQCSIGRRLVSLGKTLLGTAQDEEGVLDTCETLEEILGDLSDLHEAKLNAL